MLGPLDKQWKPLRLPATHPETDIDPYEYIYTDFDTSNPDTALLFKKYENGTIFRGVDRMRLISNIIMARRQNGGCHLDVYNLMRTKCIIAFFPLHDYVELRALEEKWIRFFQPPWLQHVDAVKDYFGEKIGMYFLWLGHYTTWLIGAAAVGFFAWIFVASESKFAPFFLLDIDLMLLPARQQSQFPDHSVFRDLYFNLGDIVHGVLEAQREVGRYEMGHGGLRGYRTGEVQYFCVRVLPLIICFEFLFRPQFEGEVKPSPIDGSDKLFFPTSKYSARIGQSAIVVGSMIALVLAIVGSIFYFKIVMTLSGTLVVDNVQMAGTIASLLNAVQIQVMNYVYGSVAVYLNEYENHRTETIYEDALIGKTFIFQFVNSFASLFYISFVKPYIQDIDPCSPR